MTGRSGGEDARVQGPAVFGIPYPWLALSLVCLGVLLANIDTSIITIALPTLAQEFGVARDEVLWVSLIYILVGTGLSPIMGRLGDLYGRKRLYVVGFACFTAATGLSAIAGSLPELLAARTVQAVAVATVIANGAAIVTDSFPAARRGRALGIMISMVGVGVAIGPVLGGVLIDILDWRAIFWTRIPLGVIGSLLVLALLRDTPAHQRPTGLDLPGSFTLFFLLGALVLAVNRGAAWGWGSPAIIGLFAATAGLVVLFIRIERRSRSPVVDLGLFRRVPFSGGILSVLLQFFGLTGAITIIPFYLVDARGFSTLEAGAVMVGYPLAMLIVSPLSGRLADRVGPRPVAVAGLVVVAAGLLSLSTLSATTPVAGIVLRMAIMGTGTAIFFAPNTVLIMQSVARDRVGTAAAAQHTARTMGNAIGIAVGGALFTSQAARYALERSPLGLDDPIVAPDALVSGIQLALLVAGLVTVLAVPAALARGRARSGPDRTARDGM